jgi:fatty acid desaturase
MTRPRSIFRYTAYDAIPALSVVGIVALIFGTLVGYAVMPWWLLVPAFLALAASYLWNLQCLSHNFIHNPFFTSRWLNRAFSVLETLALGIPHVFYHHYHLNHHFGDNDRKGPNGTTKDWSSIYRHSSNDHDPEPFWRYVLLGYWRVEVGPLLRVVWRHGWKEMAQAGVETVVLVVFWVGMAWYDWRFFAWIYLPSYYLGWMASYAEGYLEHYGAKPGNPFANSVSSYHRLYNWLWFNNGYHQEHHWDPKWHWTRMPALHEQIKDQLIRNQTRMLQGPHLTAFLEDWWQGRSRHVAEVASAPEPAANDEVRKAA